MYFVFTLKQTLKDSDRNLLLNLSFLYFWCIFYNEGILSALRWLH